MQQRSIILANHLALVGLILLLYQCKQPIAERNADISGMQLVPAGTFLMGSMERGSERPVHEIYLDAFYMDRYEVTNRQWKMFVDANPNWQKLKIDKRYHDGNYLRHWYGNNYPTGKAEHPVVYVNWYAAAAYAKWMGKRLPTEAEWERAARGPKGYVYAYGDRYNEAKANTGLTVGDTTQVGSYPPNDYGLYDMTGNVIEWCSDWFDHDYYSRSPRQNPKGPEKGESRVMRGGSWNYFKDRCTTTFRFFLIPPVAHRSCTDFIGFRCARDATS